MSNKKLFRLTIISALLLGVWMSFIALYGAVDALSTPRHAWGRGAVNCSDVNVAWQDRRDGDWDIYINRSPDGANTWGTGYEISDGPAGTNQTWPDLGECKGCPAPVQDAIYAVWEDSRPLGGSEAEMHIRFSYALPDMIYERTAWPASVTMANPPHRQEWPAVRAVQSGSNAGRAVVIWQEHYYHPSPANASAWTIMYGWANAANLLISTTWTADILYGSGYNDNVHPDMDTDGEEFYAVWTEMLAEPTNESRIWYKKSSTNGSDWSSGSLYQIASESDKDALDWPVVAVVRTTGHYTAHIAWQKHNGTDWDIHYARVEDGMAYPTSNGVNVVAPSTGNQIHPSIAVDGKKVYIAWEDDRDGANDHNIYAVRSTDGGHTFGTNIKVNRNGAGSDQGDPALDVDDEGRMQCVFDDALGGEGISISTGDPGSWNTESWTPQNTLAQWSDAANIPTLSEWGMVGFAALLGLYGLWGIRRQRQQV